MKRGMEKALVYFIFWFLVFLHNFSISFWEFFHLMSFLTKLFFFFLELALKGGLAYPAKPWPARIFPGLLDEEKEF